MSELGIRTGGPAAEPPFWEGDTGMLSLDARRALLWLVRGPSIDAERQPTLWRALLGATTEVSSRLNDLFLELVIDVDAGVAFVRNVSSEAVDVPTAVKSQTLGIVGTLMVLLLRRELLGDTSHRTIVGKEELFDALGPYRVVTDLDEAAFRRRLESSWNALLKASLLRTTDVEGRFEVSPVLRLVFGVEECRAVEEAFASLVAAAGEGAPEGAPDDGDAEVEGDEGDWSEADDRVAGGA